MLYASNIITSRESTCYQQMLTKYLWFKCLYKENKIHNNSSCIYFRNIVYSTTAYDNISEPYTVVIWIWWVRLPVFVHGNWVSHGNKDILLYSHQGSMLSHLDNSLQWRHNGHDSVSNHQPHYCLLNRLLRRESKKTSKLLVTGLCAGNSPRTGEFPHKWPVTRKKFPFDDVIMS